MVILRTTQPVKDVDSIRNSTCNDSLDKLHIVLKQNTCCSHSEKCREYKWLGIIGATMFDTMRAKDKIMEMQLPLDTAN